MITEVRNLYNLKRFISFPAYLYAEDPNWVCPQLGVNLASFDKKTNPALNKLCYELFILERNHDIIGRVGAFISRDYNRIHNSKTAFFGFFECINSQEAANSLLSRVERFARDQGMDTVTGPVDFTTNYTMGLLIDGFSRPTVMTPYNKPYYKELIERADYKKAIDLYAYIHQRETGIPERLEYIAPLLRKRYPNFFIRSLKKGRLKDVLAIREIYNSAFKDNWGFLPMTENETAHLVRYIIKKGDPDLIYLAYDLKKPVGILIALPDPVIKERLRLSVLGVIPKYRGRGIETRLVVRLLQDAFYLKHYQDVEYSLILEDNEPMNRFIQKESDCQINRVYRVYSKLLDNLL